MSFGEVATQLILFIAIMGIVAGLVVYFNDYIASTRGAMGDQRKYVTSQLRTEITIPTVYYAAQPGNDDVWVYVKNVGKETLGTDCVNVFVDNKFIELAAADIVYAGNLSEADLWRPEETLLLNASDEVDLPADDVYEALVVTCNGVTDNYRFST